MTNKLVYKIKVQQIKYFDSQRRGLETDEQERTLKQLQNTAKDCKGWYEFVEDLFTIGKYKAEEVDVEKEDGKAEKKRRAGRR